ncbi:MAG: DUF2333 family protein [Deltaproteobacteria bacterium]|nr:DUF2333 family protein [Deltaproteobacteria bacterium]
MNYTQFLTIRVVAGILIALIVLFGLWTVLNDDKNEAPTRVAHVEDTMTAPDDDFPFSDEMADETPESAHETPETAHGVPETPYDIQETAPLTHKTPGGSPDDFTAVDTHEARAKGVAFVEATISALDYEMNKRSWGWRPNDLIRFTDNVENIQRGVLEVVRRTAVALAERISRYGSSDVIDNNLENAMNWLMIKPDQYWLPSPESKYNEAIKELQTYAERLERGEASFYTRADNLIPLLLSFADLLGGCDDNLLKTHEEDGSPITWSKVDDYFYYAKGVATAMGKILHAVQEDFAPALKARGGMDLLEHAVHACHVASELDPWLVTDASLDGVFANHRANMAAPISHTRYYLDALAKTLATSLLKLPA